VVNNKAAINQAAAVHLAVSLSHSKTYLAEETGNRQAQFFFFYLIGFFICKRRQQTTI
jgi:hypothetical protein